jgi:hypothetical protein
MSTDDRAGGATGRAVWPTRSEAVSLLIQGSIMVMDTPLTTAQRRVLLHQLTSF